MDWKVHLLFITTIFLCVGLNAQDSTTHGQDVRDVRHILISSAYAREPVLSARIVAKFFHSDFGDDPGGTLSLVFDRRVDGEFSVVTAKDEFPDLLEGSLLHLNGIYYDRLGIQDWKISTSEKPPVPGRRFDFRSIGFCGCRDLMSGIRPIEIVEGMLRTGRDFEVQKRDSIIEVRYSVPQAGGILAKVVLLIDASKRFSLIQQQVLMAGYEKVIDNSYEQVGPHWLPKTVKIVTRTKQFGDTIERIQLDWSFVDLEIDMNELSLAKLSDGKPLLIEDSRTGVLVVSGTVNAENAEFKRILFRDNSAKVLWLAVSVLISLITAVLIFGRK